MLQRTHREAVFVVLYSVLMLHVYLMQSLLNIEFKTWIINSKSLTAHWYVKLQWLTKQPNSPVLHIYKTSLLPPFCQTENKRFISVNWVADHVFSYVSKSSLFVYSFSRQVLYTNIKNTVKRTHLNQEKQHETKFFYQIAGLIRCI